MSSKPKSLPKVKSVPGETIARFRAIGVDQDGQTLYRKVETGEVSRQNNQVKVSQSKIETLVEPTLETKSRSQIRQEQEIEEVAKIVQHYEGLTPEKLKEFHKKSVQNYPEITDLSDNEFVIMEIRRHSAGPAVIWSVSLIILILVTSAWLLFAETGSSILAQYRVTGDLRGITLTIVGLLDILIVLFAGISTRIYKRNKIFVTSDRLLQFQVKGLFDEKIQSIDLNGIEDVSSHQKGVPATIFNYGTVTMSTIGDESSYALNIVANPHEVKERVKNVIQAVKHERVIPLEPDKPQFPLI